MGIMFCIFAYGQTGIGKTYTMVSFSYDIITHLFYLNSETEFKELTTMKFCQYSI